MYGERVGGTIRVPRGQLRPGLEVGDNVNANGFYFEVIGIEEEFVKLKCLEDLVELNGGDEQ